MPDAAPLNIGIPLVYISAPADTFQEALPASCPSLKNEEGGPETQDSEKTAGAHSGEFRQYALPAHVLRAERELLERYRAKDFAGVLNGIYNELYVPVFFMRRYESEEDVDGFTLHLIGEQLAGSLDMLGKVCSMFADFGLVRAETTS